MPFPRFISLRAPVFFSNTLVQSRSTSAGPDEFERGYRLDVLLLAYLPSSTAIMARPVFKQWWAKILPEACQRITYVLLSS